MEFLAALVIHVLALMDVGRATVYWPGDGHSGAKKANGGSFTDEDYHIAHRSLPLGTVGVLCSFTGRRCTVVTVQDRGPYGAVTKCCNVHKLKKSRYRIHYFWQKGKCVAWQVQIRLRRGWKRRGDFDLTKPVAKQIGHTAFDYVVFVPIDNVPTDRKQTISGLLRYRWQLPTS